MNTLPKLPKVLGILLISLLLVPFVLGAIVEVAPEYINILVPLVIIVVLALGIGLFIIGRRKKPASA
jgi:hypothetical protein